MDIHLLHGPFANSRRRFCFWLFAPDHNSTCKPLTYTNNLMHANFFAYSISLADTNVSTFAHIYTVNW